MSYDTATYPYNAVVRITDTIAGRSYIASGVLISPDEVLTASHAVYYAAGGLATNIVVTPAYQAGATPFGSYTASTVHYFPAAQTNNAITAPESQIDFAVIHLSSPVLNASYLGFSSDFTGGLAHVTGYPVSAGGVQVDSSQAVRRDLDYMLLDGTAIGPGSSGGPVWIEQNGRASIVGIVSSQGYDGTGYYALVTTAILGEIERWIVQDDGFLPSPVPLAVTPSVPSRVGQAEILFSGSEGQLALWQVSNGVATSCSLLGTAAGWTAAATGQFYGTGGSGILFTNGTNIVQWKLSGGQVVAVTDVGTLAAGWTLAGTGDLTGSGTDDVVFRSADGRIAAWTMQNGMATGVSDLGVTTADWVLAAIGNLSGTGRTEDLLFINGNGCVADWLVSNGQVYGVRVLGQTDAYWTIAGIADCTGDGQNDILFRGAGGEIALWQMQGGQVSGTLSIGRTTPEWRINGLADYNADGTSDILFHNSQTGALAAWGLAGGAVSQTMAVGVAAPGWATVPAHPLIPG